MNSEPNTPALHCPNCGGSADPDSRRCAWCNTSLAVVACPKCFGALFLGMQFCPWCGNRSERDPVVQTHVELCPRCQIKLSPIKLGSTTLSECGQCGGLWVDKSSFEQICESREEQASTLNLKRDPSEAKTAPKDHAQSQRMYVSCPTCGELMHRVNFAGCSGVIVDWCREHGSWFDSNELQQVVRFIQAGGMKKAREREKEKIQDEMSRLRLEQAQLLANQGRTASVTQPWSQHEDGFLSFLSDVWKTLKD
jgi:Zn-finger nucleic acid-binding protein